MTTRGSRTPTSMAHAVLTMAVSRAWRTSQHQSSSPSGSKSRDACGPYNSRSIKGNRKFKLFLMRSCMSTLALLSPKIAKLRVFSSSLGFGLTQLEPFLKANTPQSCASRATKLSGTKRFLFGIKSPLGIMNSVKSPSLSSLETSAYPLLTSCAKNRRNFKAIRLLAWSALLTVTVPFAAACAIGILPPLGCTTSTETPVTFVNLIAKLGTPMVPV
mmetsp:Transcript_22404/g.76769  ORF Transcript_22404/g.76769 Transcript_22404/m.76769 type:complete len:216 (-) Transcript_22404:156-803(-)